MCRFIVIIYIYGQTCKFTKICPYRQMKNFNMFNVLIISPYSVVWLFGTRKKLKNVTKKFGGLRKSRTFALPLKNGMAERL